jgi:3-hydroxyisobutyrate dehydrogenase-like beta-hydroxyacid dehydrogenase
LPFLFSRKVVHFCAKTRQPHGPVDVVIKDASHALALGEATGTKLYNVELAIRHLKGVKERQGVKGDMTGIYGMIREESGLPYNNEV